LLLLLLLGGTNNNRRRMCVTFSSCHEELDYNNDGCSKVGGG
jgi:hypothetical protein